MICVCSCACVYISIIHTCVKVYVCEYMWSPEVNIDYHCWGSFCLYDNIFLWTLSHQVGQAGWTVNSRNPYALISSELWLQVYSIILEISMSILKIWVRSLYLQPKYFTELGIPLASKYSLNKFVSLAIIQNTNITCCWWCLLVHMPNTVDLAI